MNFRTLFLVVLLGLPGFLLSSLTAQSFNGKWEGVSEGEVGQMIFDKKGYITFINKGETVGGKKFTQDGIDMSMRYEIDDKKDPHTIDFIISMADEGSELARMPGIYKFVNAKTLIINMNFGGEIRPVIFDETDKNQITLTKIK
jgi:uncharacterized protein (TIGR03067 family)